MFKPSWSFTKIPLYEACIIKFGEPENTSDILDDPFVNFPNSQGGNEVSPASPESLTSPEVPTSRNPILLLTDPILCLTMSPYTTPGSRG